MDTDAIIQALIPLVGILENLQISYHVGGSVASSLYGESRQTQDVDVVADIQYEHVRMLVKLLENEYYISDDAIRGAIRHQSSFNVIHLASMVKVDIFIKKSRQFAQQEYIRSRSEIIAEGYRPFFVSSPEDIVLNKLEWYKMGEEVSTRQWKDILGVLNRQKATLDIAYLRHWAQNLQIAELLERALIEVDIEGNQ